MWLCHNITQKTIWLALGASRLRFACIYFYKKSTRNLLPQCICILNDAHEARNRWSPVWLLWACDRYVITRKWQVMSACYFLLLPYCRLLKDTNKANSESCRKRKLHFLIPMKRTWCFKFKGRGFGRWFKSVNVTQAGKTWWSDWGLGSSNDCLWIIQEPYYP